MKARQNAAILACALVGALVLLQPLPFPAGTAATATSTASSTSFAVLDEAASYGIHPNYTLAVQQADLAMLVSTGAKCVRVDVNYGPWLTGNTATITLVNSVVSSIRSDGKCLIIADAASETYRNGGAIPWSQFKTAWVQRVSTLAALYKPSYYIVVKEPGWYIPFVSDASTNPLFVSVSDWVGLTQNLTKAVHAASPSTVIGISIAGGGLNGNKTSFYGNYLSQVQSVSYLSFVGIDVYGQTAINATQNYLAHYPLNKPLWIAETWSSPTATNSSQALSDAAWMKTVYQFGLTVHAKELMPFYTNLFSGYVVPTTTSGLLTFYQGRTPAYTEFCKVVAGTP